MAQRDQRQQVSPNSEFLTGASPGRRRRSRSKSPQQEAGESQGRGVGRVRGSRGRHLPDHFPPFSDPWLPEPESALGRSLASPEVAAPRTPARPLPPVQGDAPRLPPSPALRRRIRPLRHSPPVPRPGDTCCGRPHLRVEPGRAGMGSGRAGSRRGQRTALCKLGRRLLRTLAKAATQ